MMIRSPICSSCLQSDFLCQGCNEKIKIDGLSEEDLSLIRFLHDLSKKNASLRDICVRSVRNVSGITLLQVDQDDVAKVIGRQGRIISKISEFAQVPVKVIGNGSIQEQVQSALYPARVRRISIVITPKGEYKRVVLYKGDESRLNLNLDALKTIVWELTGERMEVEFE